MESGKISDDQISASTTFYDNRWLPRQARLNNDDNAWTPAEDSNKEFIQVFICRHIYRFMYNTKAKNSLNKSSIYDVTLKITLLGIINLSGGGFDGIHNSILYTLVYTHTREIEEL